MLLLAARVISVIWIAAFILYYISYPSLFTRMYPNELGELLSGWFAPMAAAWIGVTVYLQKKTLDGQNEELKRSEQALLLQSQQFQASLEQVRREALKEKLNRLLERIMLTIQRAAKLAEPFKIIGASKSDIDINVSEIIGKPTRYLELLQSNEKSYAVREFTKKSEDLRTLLAKGHAITLPLERAEELCLELTFIVRLAAEADVLLKGHPEPDIIGDLPDEKELAALQENALSLSGTLEELVSSLRALD